MYELQSCRVPIHYKLVPEQARNAPPTAAQNAQRMDQFEEELVSLKKSMAAEIAEAVKKAALEMQVILTTQISASIDQASTRLEGRKDRSLPQKS